MELSHQLVSCARGCVTISVLQSTGIAVSDIQQIVLTNLGYLYLRVPSCGALVTISESVSYSHRCTVNVLECSGSRARHRHSSSLHITSGQETRS